MRRPRTTKLFLILVLLVVPLTACAPTPEGTLRPFTHADGQAAVDEAFSRSGPTVLACAIAIARNESGYWPYAGLWPRVNKTHHGLFQLWDGFYGSIQAAAATRNEPASFFNPFQNALAAAAAYESRGTFQVNWAATAPPGCP